MDKILNLLKKFNKNYATNPMILNCNKLPNNKLFLNKIFRLRTKDAISKSKNYTIVVGNKEIESTRLDPKIIRSYFSLKKFSQLTIISTYGVSYSI